MSPRYERRQRGGGGALLLLIAAAALVVAVLAIFTDVFSGKKAPDISVVGGRDAAQLDAALELIRSSAE